MRRLAVAWVVGASALLPWPVLAKVTVCNKYTATIHAAIGYVINGDTETQGWWTVAPGKCTVVDAGPLASPFYLMARTDPDVQGNMNAWGNGTHLAISMDKFHYYDAEKVGKNDNAMDFDEVTKADGKDQPDVTWTVEDADSVAFSYDEAP